MTVVGTSPPPARPPSLVGRARELRALVDALSDDVRVVALHGAPGVGKTALAQTLAADTERRVAWVDANGIAEIDDLDASLSDVLGLAHPKALPASLLARAPCLVVLDGVDRIREALPSWLAPMAELGPELTFLVTSRSRVDAGWGTVMELAPLGTNPEGGGQSDSLKLWIERVRHFRGDYTPAPDELEVVRELLVRMDGLALAIELTAARAALVGAYAVLQGLERGAGSVSLRNVLEDAWDRLPAELQEALARLSIFRGPFDAQAAAAVLDLPEELAFERLHRLRHASLLSAAPTDRGPAGDLRLRLLGPIREHARRQLDASGGTEGAIQSHADHHARAARRSLAPGARGIDLGESDELAALMDRALADHDPALLESALWVAVAVERQSWASTAWIQDRLPRLVEAADGAAIDAGLSAAAELAIAALRVRTGPLDEALRRCQRALTIYESTEDDRGMARTLRTQALVQSQLGKPVEAETSAAEAVERAHGDRALEGLTLHTAARMALRRGEHTRAMRFYEDALERHRRADDLRWQALALSELAIVHLDRGELDAAETRVEAGLALRADDPLIEALFLGARGNIAHDRGELDGAIAGYEAASDRADRYGNARYAGLCRGYRGIALLECGEHGAAQAALEEAAAAMRAVGDTGHDRLFGAYALVARKRQGASVPDLAERLAVPPGADAWLAGALNALTTGQAEAGNGLDARLALRIGRGVPAARPPKPGLVVGRRWFSTPARGRVDTRRRAAARGILNALVEHHEQKTEVPLSADQLIAAGWPGERILPTAAKNRLHVTLHRLRDLGLREGLVFTDEGWMLDARLLIVRDPD